MAGFGIKEPLAASLHNGHGEWPVLVTHQQECAVPALRIHGNALLFVGLSNKISGVLPVLREFAAKYDVLATGPKNLAERNHVELLGGVDQHVRSLLRSVKAPGARSRGSGSSWSFFRCGLLRKGKERRAQTRPGYRTDNPKKSGEISIRRW